MPHFTTYQIIRDDISVTSGPKSSAEVKTPGSVGPNGSVDPNGNRNHMKPMIKDLTQK